MPSSVNICFTVLYSDHCPSHSANQPATLFSFSLFPFFFNIFIGSHRHHHQLPIRSQSPFPFYNFRLFSRFAALKKSKQPNIGFVVGFCSGRLKHVLKILKKFHLHFPSHFPVQIISIQLQPPLLFFFFLFFYFPHQKKNNFSRKYMTCIAYNLVVIWVIGWGSLIAWLCMKQQGIFSLFPNSTFRVGAMIGSQQTRKERIQLPSWKKVEIIGFHGHSFGLDSLETFHLTTKAQFDYHSSEIGYCPFNASNTFV